MDDRPARPPAAAHHAPGLTQGLECLVADHPHLDPSHRPAPAAAARPAFDFDIVIVGSGYGAAVAARQLAGCRPANDPQGPPVSICLLERGLEYPAGSFPDRWSELPGHVRFSTPGASAGGGRRTGLFDLRLGGDLVALVANGLGGGSLINAGVMLPPAPQVLQQPHWPAALRQPGVLDAHFAAVSAWLGADLPGPAGPAAASAAPPAPSWAKTAALQCLAGAQAQAVPLTIALQPGRRTAAGVPLQPCIGCGDCATGCNHGAKHSLDVGLLAQVAATPGVRLVTGATVLQLLPAGPGAAAGWVLQVQHTDRQLRRGQPQAFELRARRVVLAAGTLGSTEILLRSRRAGLALSPRLGRRFSGNGDLIAALHDTRRKVQALADPATAPAGRAVGPTITAMLDQRQGAGGQVLQDLAVPAALHQLFCELFTTTASLHALARPGAPADGSADPCAVQPAAMRRTLPLAVIGHDDAAGRLRLPPRRARTAAHDDGDGALQIHWPQHRDGPAWPSAHQGLQALAAAQGGPGGTLLPNPAWQALPDALQQSLRIAHGPLLTVHPLGGCVMADSAATGVVDHLGRVFDTRPGAPAPAHDSLVVLDGATVPGSLGINPALTIAALAHRAAGLLRPLWGLGNPQPASAQAAAAAAATAATAAAAQALAQPAASASASASASAPPAAPPTRTQPTLIELTERMGGSAVLADGRSVWLELTLVSRPTALAGLMAASSTRRIVLDGRHSRLRLLAQPPQRHTGEPADHSQVLLQARLDGDIALFVQQPATGWLATARATVHWLHNRGVRDLVQARHEGQGPRPGRQSVRDTLALASHAAGVRRLDYTLRASAATGTLAALLPDGSAVQGAKRLQYDHAASPLQQLMELRLAAAPWLRRGPGPLLCLDLAWLARQRVPLLRVVGQQDQPTALADLAAFAAYALRVLVRGHLWSFRKPDAPAHRPAGGPPQRLPGVLPGLPPPAVHWLPLPLPPGSSAAEIARAAGGAVKIRLARYRPGAGGVGKATGPGQAGGAAAALPPVLLIHGYSASGTTFAHPAVQPSLVQHLCATHRREVWVLDMRSSCGLATATLPWAFEDMGLLDIPLAVEHICQASGVQQLDVVAHCMGAAMLCMGLLAEQPATPGTALHQRIRRLVLSQVGPAVLLTPANTARAVLMRWAAPMLGGRSFEFTPRRRSGLAGQLLDRLLCAMPYPPGEFQRENPLWPPGRRLPWVGTRHRIDALFGRVFNLANMDAGVLARLDDFFGPFSLATVSQVMHFARHGQITDRTGFNRFVSPQRLAERLRFPMLSLHAPANGLADAGTAERLRVLFDGTLGPGGSHRALVLPDAGLGHQDSLIGSARATRSTREAISSFLGVAP